MLSSWPWKLLSGSLAWTLLPRTEGFGLRITMLFSRSHPFMAPSSSQVAAGSESLSLGPAWPRQLSWTPSLGRSGCVCPGNVCWSPAPSALSSQSHTAPSASDFTASESQVDKKWRKQMVGLRFLFSRLDWKESFHTGSVCFRSFVLHRGKLTFQIEARTGSRFWLRLLKRRADGSGSGFQRLWAGRRCPLTLHVTSPGAASRAFAFLSVLDAGLRSFVSAQLRSGVCHPVLSRFAGRLVSLAVDAACYSLYFPA